MSTAHSSQMLSSKLAGVRGKQLYLSLGAGLAWLALAAVALLAVEMGVDYKWNLPVWARLLFLVLDGVVLAALFTWHIYRPLTTQPDDEEVALRVERSGQFSDFRSRLIAATQFGQASLPSGIAGVLVQALVKQTEQMARPKDFNAIVPTDRFARALVLAGLVVGLGALAFNKYPDDARDLLRRAFLAPDVEVPRFTHMDSITTFYLADGNRTEPRAVFARDDQVRIEVAVKDSSRVKDPTTATIAILYASGERAISHSATNTAPPGAAGRYQLTLPNVRESFTITASAGDAFSISKEVRVEPRPAVREIEFTQEFPAYTGLNPQERRRGDLTLLVGSKLKVTLTASKPVAEGTAYLFNKQDTQPKAIPVSVDSADPHQVTVTLPLRSPDLNGFSVKLLDRNGFESRNEALYRLVMLPDKPPVVRVLEPVRKEEKVTQRARLQLRISVRDDYAVDQVVLKYTHGNAPPQSLTLKPETPGQSFGDRALIPFDWIIRDLKPPVGTEIEYWIEATDRCAPQQGRGESRHLLAIVVSDDEKRRDLQNRASDSITGVNETASTQEKLNQELGEIIRVRAIPGPQENE